MSPENKYQVIVVGGGPAGSTTALYLAKRGIEVLVIDGRDPIGTPLQCGELVPSNQEMRRLCPGVPDVDDLFQTPESAICRNVPEMHLVTPSGKRLRYDFDGLVLDRVAHDEALVERATGAGAEYLVGTRVKSVSEDSVTLSDGRVLTAGIIVGAGGHLDVIRRSHWTEKSMNIPVKFAIKEGNHTDALELHFGSVAPGGYAWVFPKDGCSNIGLGIQTRFSRGVSLNSYAEKFIDSYSGDTIYRGAGALPMSGTISTFSKGNHVVVGDAAGMVLPSNGAGITIAMIGGRIAANAIADHILDGKPLREYEREWKRQMGTVMSRSKRAFRLGSILFRLPDWVVDLLFNPITKPFIWRAVTCRSLLSLRI